jgi:rhamnose transport system ATP-binding protein
VETDKRSGDTESRIVLEAVDIRKSFGGIRALKGVSLKVSAGETHALVGENGAGKSTLIKIFTGALQPDAGEIRIHGKTVEHHSPANARALGIAAIYQQPALFPDLTVEENIELASGGTGRWRRINWTQRRAHAAKILEQVGARIRPDTLAKDLSMPEQQLIEIAKAVDANASVLILDEPTASLGEGDVEHLFGIMEAQRARGTAIIYISHRFEELFRVADRVSVLRDGSSIGTYTMAGISNSELIHLMVGRELETVFPKREAVQGDTVFDVRHLSSKQGGVKNISLQVRRGEILGLAGLIGSGRTQFAEALFGLIPSDTGEVRISGKPVVIGSPQDAIREGLAYVPEDRRKHGVILDMTVAANVTISNLQKISANGFIRFEDEEKIAKDYISTLAVKTPTADTPVANLSGGNQQKVALARWLMTDPKVLILDEPTQGIDVGAKSEIYGLMSQLAQNGTAVLMISSDMNEILGMSDRIAVMVKGEIVGILSRDEATPHKILEMTLRLDSPIPERQVQ